MSRSSRLPALVAVMLIFGVPGMAQDRSKKAAPISEVERLKLLKTFASEFVNITPGKGPYPKSFRMGTAAGPASEAPLHEVTLSTSFSIARYEVPQNLYEAVIGTNPSRWKGPRNSAEMFSWTEAVVFCRTATKMMREAGLVGKDEEIRLPSEAEWEYCCRAGTTTAYSFGDKARKETDEGTKASLLDPYGWHTGNASGNDPPVGALKPNAWGLYDMHGYLYEFVADGWHDTYKNAPADGGAWDATRPRVMRVIRGGSWRDRFESLRSAARVRLLDHAKSAAIGMRCVKARVR